MTEWKDFMQLMVTLRAAYSSEKFMPDKESARVWYEMLKDIDYPTLARGVYKLIQSTPYPPTIATIREACVSMQGVAQLSDLEAWALVRKALSNGYYGAEGEFAKLPLLVQKAVGSPANIREMAQASLDSMSVYQAQFLRAYRAEVQRAADLAKLSPQLRQLLTQTTTEMIEGDTA